MKENLKVILIVCYCIFPTIIISSLSVGISFYFLLLIIPYIYSFIEICNRVFLFEHSKNKKEKRE